MRLFDMFKKKDKIIKGKDNMEHILALADTNDFVVAMTEYLDNKTKLAIKSDIKTFFSTFYVSFLNSNLLFYSFQ